MTKYTISTFCTVRHHYLNISNNQFNKKPIISNDIDFFDENNLYNLYGPSLTSYCFDFDLFSRVDLDFYFISSKDNILLKFKNNYICYNRKDLKFIEPRIYIRLYLVDWFYLNKNQRYNYECLKEFIWNTYHLIHGRIYL